ncbi:hypothetical protein ACH47C_20995 [Streptomyces rishiriensis]|nr:hypothetical protein [Streptomyces rishiriensis]
MPRRTAQGTQYATLPDGATPAGWRGRSLYRAPVAVRLALAAERGIP